MSSLQRARVRRPHLLVVLMTAVLCAALTGPAAGAPAPFTESGDHQHRSPDTVPVHSRQVRAGVALDRARALFDGRAVATARPARQDRDATMVLRELVRLRGALSAVERAEADRLLARPTDGIADPNGQGYDPATTPRVVCDVVCVHWVDTSVDAVAQTDTDLDTVPDYVETVAATVAGVRQTYANAGYKTPKPDGTLGGDERFDVYLADIGASGLYGYCTSDQVIPAAGPYDAWGYCVLDNDYAVTEFPTNTPIENLRVTVAHEYFHAVQFAYDIFEDLWFMEATATWAEDEVFDAVDDNVQYLDYGPGAQPWMPLDYGTAFHQYGGWLFFRYLTERFPTSQGGMPTLVRDMWRRADASATGPDEYSIQAVRSTLAARSASFPTVFAQFANANRTPARSYQEGAANHYPTAPLWGSVTLSPSRPLTTWGRPILSHLTSATTRFTPARGLRRLRIEVNMAMRSRGSTAIVTVYKRSGSVASSMLPLNTMGDGARSYPFTRSTVKYVELTLVNASTRYRCWTSATSPYSCLGAPLDESLVAMLRGVASR